MSIEIFTLFLMRLNSSTIAPLGIGVLQVPYSIAGDAEPRLQNIEILLFNGIETTHFARFPFSDWLFIFHFIRLLSQQSSKNFFLFFYIFCFIIWRIDDDPLYVGDNLVNLRSGGNFILIWPHYLHCIWNAFIRLPPPILAWSSDETHRHETGTRQIS